MDLTYELSLLQTAKISCSESPVDVKKVIYQTFLNKKQKKKLKKQVIQNAPLEKTDITTSEVLHVHYREAEEVNV